MPKVVDERGRNLMCDRTLPSGLVFKKLKILIEIIVFQKGYSEEYHTDNNLCIILLNLDEQCYKLTQNALT